MIQKLVYTKKLKLHQKCLITFEGLKYPVKLKTNVIDLHNQLKFIEIANPKATLFKPNLYSVNK